VDLDQGDALPPVVGFSAVVVYGGPDSANDGTERMRNELAWIRQGLASHVPYLGICLGLQTLVKAAGGRVIPSPTKEVGCRDPAGHRYTVQRTAAGQNDPLLAALGDSFPLFQLHGETVELTEAMILLGVGNICHNQIVRVAMGAYGIQGHVELTRPLLESWLDADPDLRALDREVVLADFTANQAAYAQVGRQLFRNFLQIAGL